jgi:DHA1 family multidrug resistance protein-like MFS transporter
VQTECAQQPQALPGCTVNTSGDNDTLQSTMAIYLFSFFMDITIAFLMLGLNFRAVDIGASPAQIGVLVASFSVPYTLLCFFLARRLSSLDARVSMAISSVGLLILCVVSGLVSSLVGFILLGALIGTVTAFFWPPLEHYLGQGKSSEELCRALSRFNLWWCSGYVLATGTCGLLYRWKVLDIRLPFVVGAACLLPIIAGSPFLSRADSPKTTNAACRMPAAETSIPLRKKRFFLTFARIFMFLTYAAAGCVLGLFPKLGDALHLSKPVVSRLLSLVYLGRLLSFYLLGRTTKWHYNLRLLLANHALMAVAFVIAFASNHPALFAMAFVIVGLVSGLSYFSSLYYTLHEPVFRSSLAGVHEAFLSSGWLVGSLLFGAIAQASNLKIPYLLLALIFAVFGLYMSLQGRRLGR